MTKNHMKRIAAPKTWPIARKISKFITRPNPGSHDLNTSIPLGVFMKEMLGVTDTNKENKYVLTKKGVEVNGKPVKDFKRPVGLMDVVKFAESKDVYRIILTEKRKLKAVKADPKLAKARPLKIVNKKLMKGKKTSLIFFDGTNLLVDKDTFKTGDTVLLSLDDKKDSNKIIDHLPLKEGVLVYLIGGSHVGHIGKVVKISGNTISCETSEKKQFETLKKFAFVIGKDKPVININDETLKG